MSIENIATLVTIIAGILGIVFGQKPLADLIKEIREKRLAKNKPSFNTTPLAETPRILVTDMQNKEIQESDPVVESFMDLVKKGDYKTALTKAKPERNKLNSKVFSSDLYKQLALDDFDIWHARALIYTGETEDGEDGLKKLDKVIKGMESQSAQPEGESLLYAWRKNMVLGRAHNDKGYAHWMESGHFEIAIKEFSRAIQHYATIDIEQKGDEIESLLATSYDNLGRVYSQLGNRLKAESLIEDGLQIRSRLGIEDRYALSLNSSAISFLAFGDHYQALELGREALKKFQAAENIRGEGLAKITIGQAQRQADTLWSYKKNDERLIHLHIALKTLKDAEKIFTDRIYEPIRLCQIFNEIGCVYREIWSLKPDLDTADSAKEHLMNSLKIAEDNKYEVMYVDGCEDLAQVFKSFNDNTNARKWLSKAKDVIKSTSSNYFFAEGKEVQTVDSGNCVEDFWQHLGKIHALQGHIAFEAENKKGRLASKDIKKILEKPLEEFALAAGYFGRFLEIASKSGQVKRESIRHVDTSSMLMNHRMFGKQVYSQLRELNMNAEDIKEITKILRTIKDKYNLQDLWIDEFFSDAIDLLIHTKPQH